MSKIKNMKLRYKVGLGVATSAAVLGGGVAFATTYIWNTTATTNASGTNPQATAQTESFTVTGVVNANASSGLYPNGPGGSISVTLTNANPYGLAVTNAVVDSVAGGITSGVTGCASHASYTYSSTLTVPGGSGQQATGTVGTVTLDLSTPNNCQGATFTVPLVVTGTQNTN